MYAFNALTSSHLLRRGRRGDGVAVGPLKMEGREKDLWIPDLSLVPSF